MITSKRIFATALVGVCVALAGCGDDDEGAPIPGDTAVALQSELDGVQGRLNEGSAGACRDILEGPRGPNIDRVRELLDAMPDDVDPDVRSALEDSFDRLWELVQQECDEKAAQEQEEREQQPEPAPEPEQTETETAPPETETEPVPPPEEELPPEGDGDNDGEIPPGNGNGNGGGGGNGGGAVGPGSLGGDG